MKVLQNKQKGYESYIEWYDLDGIVSGRGDLHSGLFICYWMIRNKNTTFLSLTAEAEGELGNFQKILRYDCSSFATAFSSLDSFVTNFIENEMTMWDLEILYQDVAVSVSGQTDLTEIGVSYPIGTTIDIKALLVEIENIGG